MNSFIRTGLLILFLFSIGLGSAAQPPSLYFERLTQANGLSNNKVNCILQDKKKFTWIGTDDGLNRYDGNNFIVFKHAPGDSTTISGNTITALHEDKDGVIWIATADGGLTRYDPGLEPKKQFQQFKHHPGNKNSIPVNIVNALLEDADGYLWLATSGAGVIRFDKKKKIFSKPAGTGIWTIYDLCLDKNGSIWAGREGGSILKIDPRTMTLNVDQRYANNYANLPHVVVTALFKDHNHNIWFGSWDKAVYKVNAATGNEQSFVKEQTKLFSFGEDEAIAFNEDHLGRIWIGGRYTGLYLYDPIANHFYNYLHNPAREGTLSSNKVNCIFMDAAGMVWLGTDNGISLYNKSHQQFVQQFLPNYDKQDPRPLIIYDFYKDERGELLIGTNKGIYTSTKDGEYIFRKITHNGTALSVTRFFKDEDGPMYLGTNYSLFRFDMLSGKISLLPNTDKDEVMSKLIESRIVSIVKDTINSRPVLITAPYGHYFSYYDFQHSKWVSRKDTVENILNKYKLNDNLIRRILKTTDGSLWLANAKHGLIKLNKNSGGSTTFMNDPSGKGSISNNNVFDIREDSRQNLWVSTYGGGLNYFDTKKKTFRHFSSANNLLEGLEIDKHGNVWSISNGNLQKFNQRTQSFTYMSLPDEEKTGGVKGYIYKDGSGTMYVAGPGYFISFVPEEISFQSKLPEVYLTDFSIFNHSFAHLLAKDEIALRHTQNFFTIHFAAPFYEASAPVQYSYMLEGVDPSWVNVGTATQAPYTNLGGGEYLFKVRATTTPGIWSPTITSIRIRIIPPFWKRWWFFAVVFLSLAAVGYALYRYRINELLKRQSIRNKIAQDLHDSVGSTLSSISVYSQVAKIYNDQGRQTDLKSTLEKISMASSEMISEMSDTVWAINPRNDNMKTILQRMDSFARPLMVSQDIIFHFSPAPDMYSLNLDMTRRKNFYLIFKEAINNALKYSGCKNLWVEVNQHHNQLELIVKDDGKGFNQEKIKEANSLSGNGLRNMQRRAEEMDGRCVIKSEDLKGTTIHLAFPIP